jgi:hypothetical protein
VERRYDLVAFDMDGVLVNYTSCWTWVHDHFKVTNEASLKAFIEGDIDDMEFMRRDISLWRRERPELCRKELDSILAPVPMNEGIEITRAVAHGPFLGVRHAEEPIRVLPVLDLAGVRRRHGRLRHSEELGHIGRETGPVLRRRCGGGVDPGGRTVMRRALAATRTGVTDRSTYARIGLTVTGTSFSICASSLLIARSIPLRGRDVRTCSTVPGRSGS